MEFTNEEMNEFCEIWKREFKEELSSKKAQQIASKLVELYALLAKPLPSVSGDQEARKSDGIIIIRAAGASSRPHLLGPGDAAARRRRL